MSNCPQLTTRDAGNPFITKDNLYELIPSTYNRSPGTSVTVRCADGISLVGEATFTCRSSGSWSYQTKPYCTASVPTTTEDSSTSTDIVLGIICGVAGIIVTILVIMLIVVYRRDKQHRESQKSVRSMTTFSGYGRGEPPAPYNQYNREPANSPPRGTDNPMVHGSRFDREKERDRDRDRYRDFSRDMDLDSQLSNSMYLPRDLHEDRRDFHRNENETAFYTGIKRPQLRSWISRGPMYGNNYMAGVHREEDHFRHDPLLWRNAVLY